jgi:hypothetical protein
VRATNDFKQSHSGHGGSTGTVSAVGGEESLPLGSHCLAIAFTEEAIKIQKITLAHFYNLCHFYYYYY